MLKGLGGLADMGKMMKAAQDMQTKMAEMQEGRARARHQRFRPRNPADAGGRA